MILVADASALIALATCDSLALLDAIFGNVLVPDAVYASPVFISESLMNIVLELANELPGRD